MAFFNNIGTAIGFTVVGVGMAFFSGVGTAIGFAAVGVGIAFFSNVGTAIGFVSVEMAIGFAVGGTMNGLAVGDNLERIFGTHISADGLWARIGKTCTT